MEELLPTRLHRVMTGGPVSTFLGPSSTQVIHHILITAGSVKNADCSRGMEGDTVPTSTHHLRRLTRGVQGSMQHATSERRTSRVDGYTYRKAF